MHAVKARNTANKTFRCQIFQSRRLTKPFSLTWGVLYFTTTGRNIKILRGKGGWVGLYNCTMIWFGKMSIVWLSKFQFKYLFSHQTSVDLWAHPFSFLTVRSKRFSFACGILTHIGEHAWHEMRENLVALKSFLMLHSRPEMLVKLKANK